MKRFDFAIRATNDALAVYPLTCRALAALETVLGVDNLVFDLYQMSVEEVITLRAAGFHFC